jgi:predicted nucleic-acid-binding protein
MRAVDTNVLVRLLVRDAPAQLAAAEAFVLPGAWVSHLVLMEAAWVLGSVYGVKPARLAAGIDALLDHEHIVVQDAHLVVEALQEFRKHPKVGFSDCLILQVARSAGHVPMGTFDRDLGKLAGAHKLSTK